MLVVSESYQNCNNGVVSNHLTVVGRGVCVVVRADLLRGNRVLCECEVHSLKVSQHYIDLPPQEVEI